MIAMCTYFCYTSACKYSDLSLLLQTNTYQAIVITDHEMSYAIFTYNCGQLQWAGLGAPFPTIGFYSSSDGIFENHPLTGQRNAFEIACGPNPMTNNVIYSIGMFDAGRLKRMCRDWFFSDVDNFNPSVVSLLNVIIQPCPCSIFQAVRDRRFFRFVSNPNKITVCFGSGLAATRECCYSTDSQTFGALVTGTENGGSLLLLPLRPFESFQQNNGIPQELCCSPGVGLCNLYYERRPPNFCFRYRPPRFCK